MKPDTLVGICDLPKAGEALEGHPEAGIVSPIFFSDLNPEVQILIESGEKRQKEVFDFKEWLLKADGISHGCKHADGWYVSVEEILAKLVGKK